MKFQTTRKAIVNGSNRLVYAPYAELQYLLRYHDPVAYTAGIYGWNFDVYEINGLTICTGYRNMPGRRANNIDEYERRASEIWHSKEKSFEEQKEEIERLLSEFCAQA